MKLLLSVANLVPDSRIVEGRAVDFLHFQNVSVEMSCTFQVVNGNENVMEVESVHGRQWRRSNPSRCCTEDLVRILQKRQELFSLLATRQNDTRVAGDGN